MKNRESLLMLNVLLISLSLYLPPCGASEDSPISSTTATIYSVADAYVSSSSPNENHGDLNSVYVGASSEQDFTYVMFNLSSIPSDAEIISATLKLYLSSTEGEIYGSPADTIGTHYCSDNSWTELGITWNNKPDFDLEPTGTWAFTMIYTVKVYKSWDITEDVRMTLPSGILTEVLKFESKTGDGYAIFQSREGLSDPKLEVEYVAYTLQIKAATGGATNPASGSYAYVIGRVVSVLATSKENYVLDHWELDSIDAGSDNPIEVIMNSNHTLQPVFRLVTFNLTIIANDGGMTSPMPTTRTYDNNTSVSVTAISNPGYSFDRWLLDGGKRTENPITVTMNANHTLEAFFVDAAPEIDDPTQVPSDYVPPYQNVTVWGHVSDKGSGLCNVTLWYSVNNGTEWACLEMTAVAPNMYETTIPVLQAGSWVIYKIIAYDNGGNQAINDNHGYHYVYRIIPEFQSALILLLFMIATLLAVTACRIKKFNVTTRRRRVC